MERCSSKMECYRVPWSEENQHSCYRNMDSRPTTIQFVSSLGHTQQFSLTSSVSLYSRLLQGMGEI